MKHYGDITKINGAEVPIVDIVTGGSPCQDLSVANGKRAGLDGERSGLFMEQIRVIKEMRNECIRQLSMRGADYPRSAIRPRYMVWENVCGAFSSNKGEDFRCVLEETARIADETAVIPRLAEKQKWTNAGCIMGDGWSIAWRVHDAQFWGKTIRDIDSGDVLALGTPQRRRRIALVADFAGQTAPEILFECKGVFRNPQSERTEGETITADSERNLDKTSYTVKTRGGAERDSKGRKAGKGALVQEELSATLGTSQDQTLIAIENHPADSRVKISEDGVVQTLSSRMGTGGNNVPLVSYGLDRASFNQGKNALYNFSVEEETAQTLVSRGPGGVLTKQ